MLRLEKTDKVRVHKHPCHRVVGKEVFHLLVGAGVVVHLIAEPNKIALLKGEGELYQDNVGDGAGFV